MSGLTKPVKISNELADFLSLGHDELIARTQVTKKIMAYVKENKLQKEGDGRIIIPDDKLMKLFKLDNKNEFSMFKIQTYLKEHYPK